MTTTDEPTSSPTMAEIRRRQALPLREFERQYPDFIWSVGRRTLLLTDEEGGQWMPVLSPSGVPYDLESTPEEDEEDREAYLRFLDYRRAGGRMISLEELERELDLEESRDRGTESS